MNEIHVLIIVPEKTRAAGISSERVDNIWHQHLNIKNLSTKWVSQLTELTKHEFVLIVRSCFSEIHLTFILFSSLWMTHAYTTTPLWPKSKQNNEFHRRVSTKIEETNFFIEIIEASFFLSYQGINNLLKQVNYQANISRGVKFCLLTVTFNWMKSFEPDSKLIVQISFFLTYYLS